ncbi:MAG: DUF192 domain-containing protein [Dehalococcoidia bacterium]|nr:DUF192 domain-containing protein [Dehalococcoidia bacterium]
MTSSVEQGTSGVRDADTGRELAHRLEWATNPWTRFRGLMMRARLDDGGGMVIRPCGSIHMMFMRFPIDAVFFDADGTVTKVARRVRPWIGFSMGGRGAKCVIELPSGAADGVERGHRLEFTP